MLPALQPSRPKHPQPPRPHHPSYTQTRTLHDPSSPSQAPTTTTPSSSSIGNSNPAQQRTSTAAPTMPTTTAPLQPARGTPLYDAAIRHPVFFTSQLRKLPFPVAQGGSQGFSPVASGYVEERRREGGAMGGGRGTKL